MPRSRSSKFGNDAKDNAQLATQLAEKAKQTDLNTTNSNVALKADKTYVDTQIAGVGNGSPKGTYTTLTALQTAYPTGTTGIYLVTADGKWYYWNGSAWTAGGVYQSTGISDGTVNYSKTDFLDVGTNLFDKTTLTDGYSINSSTGALTANTNFFSSDYIKVSPSTLYANNNSNHVVFYDSNKTFISGLNVVTSFTTPFNTAYIRIDHDKTKTTTIDQLMVASGSSLPSTYVPYGIKFKKYLDISIDTLQINDNAITKEKIPNSSIPFEKTNFLTIGDNIFDYTTVTLGYYLFGGQTVTANANYSLSDYIPVISNTLYATNNGQHVTFYDASKNYISSVNVVTSFTTPSNCAYIRIDIPNTTIANSAVMVVKGSSLPSSYVPYMYKFTKKLYTDIPTIDVDHTSFLQKNNNLFDLSTITDGYNVSPSTGALVVNSSFFSSDFIPVSANTVYSNNNSNHIVFYDANKVFISYVNVVTSFTTPSNAVFIRIDHNKTSTTTINQLMVIAGSALPTVYVPFAQFKYPQPTLFGWENKKWSSYGHSIVAGNTWQPSVVSKLSLVHTLRGIGGTTVAETGSTAYVDASGNYVDRPIAYGGTTDTPPVGTTVIHSSFCNTERINAMIPTDANVITIMGDTNDYMQNVPIGTINDSVDTTFYGGWNSLLNQLYTRVPNATIFIITAPFQHNEFTTGNSLGKSLEDYRIATRAVAKKFGYPVIEIQPNMRINELNYTTYYSDTTHPNATGGKKISEIVIGNLKALVPVS